MSIGEFDRLVEPEDQRYELDEGELIAMSRPPPLHNGVAVEALFHVRVYLKSNPIGLDPAKDIEGGPGLAIEVLSPTGTMSAMRPKIRQHLAAGARAIWLVYPGTLGPRARPIRLTGSRTSPEFPSSAPVLA